MFGSKSSSNFPHFCEFIPYFLKNTYCNCTGIVRWKKGLVWSYFCIPGQKLLFFLLSFVIFLVFIPFIFVFFPSSQILTQRKNIFPWYLSQNNGRIFTPGRLFKWIWFNNLPINWFSLHIKTLYCVHFCRCRYINVGH